MNNNGILDTINTLIIETQVKLISTILLVLMIWLLRSIVLRVLFQRIKDDRNRGVSRQIVGYTAFFLGLVLIGRLWLEGFQSLLIVLTLILAALIVALKELFLNIASWSIIAWRQLFRIGDHIKIGGHFGEVMEMNMIYITLVELDEKLPTEPAGHRVVKIPNSLVLTQPIVNDTEGSHELWYELTVAISLDSNWQEAQKILLALLHKQTLSSQDQEVGREKEIFAHVTVMIHASKIILTGRYLCESDWQPEIEQAIWQDILTSLQIHERIKLV
jgi:small-conductance mechanosensitive channel